MRLGCVGGEYQSEVQSVHFEWSSYFLMASTVVLWGVMLRGASSRRTFFFWFCACVGVSPFFVCVVDTENCLVLFCFWLCFAVLCSLRTRTPFCVGPFFRGFFCWSVLNTLLFGVAPTLSAVQAPTKTKTARTTVRLLATAHLLFLFCGAIEVLIFKYLDKAYDYMIFNEYSTCLLTFFSK